MNPEKSYYAIDKNYHAEIILDENVDLYDYSENPDVLACFSIINGETTFTIDEIIVNGEPFVRGIWLDLFKNVPRTKMNGCVRVIAHEVSVDKEFGIGTWRKKK